MTVGFGVIVIWPVNKIIIVVNHKFVNFVVNCMICGLKVAVVCLTDVRSNVNFCS